MTYAADTSVSVMRSIEEIRTLVMKSGGAQFILKEDVGIAAVCFKLHDRIVMFDLTLPERTAFATKPSRRRWASPLKRSETEQQKAWEQACRSRWRALLLTIKSKLVSIEAGVETFEEAFLAHVMVPGAKGSERFAKIATEYIAAAYAGGPTMPLLGSGSSEPKH